jgi:glutamate N-acetyltransferase / amino-acid N-acetyltransferase
VNTFPKCSGGVLAPAGFTGGAIACGIKTGRPDRLDLALVVSDVPAACAATFTTNAVKAAPVRVSMEHLGRGPHRAIILNSGNANACTGRQGMAAARAMAFAAASKTGCPPGAVMVCSTGRIGVPLPIKEITAGIERLALSRASGEPCARAIMTSDTAPKQVAFLVKTPDGNFRIGGMAKGAGMIDPTMATMLAVITTDARIPRRELSSALRHAVAASFNRITIDGDMSTNDTVVALANGASGIRPDPVLFRGALEHACSALARMIVADGEGVTRFVEVHVRGAARATDARRAAEAVANSTLVKCAWAGGDPNWGRIMDAIGYSGARIDESRIAIDYGGLPIVRHGMLAPTPWKDLRTVAARKLIRVVIDLRLGPFSHEVWTSDLTEAYVKFNLGE